MYDMQVYIRAIGSDQPGEWFPLPLNEDVMMEAFQIKSDMQYVIEDYIFPVPIDYYARVSDINDMYNMVMLVQFKVPLEDISLVCDSLYISLAELTDQEAQIRRWSCGSMTDLAETMVKGGYCGEIPQWLYSFIKYAEMGNSLFQTGRFVEGKKGIYEMMER